MGSPRRIFKGLTVAELAVIKAAALERVTSGTFTQLGGAQKNSTIEYMKIEDILDEVNYELSVLNGTVGPSTVSQDFSGLRQMPNTVS
jgi:hypothetical protein